MKLKKNIKIAPIKIKITQYSVKEENMQHKKLKTKKKINQMKIGRKDKFKCVKKIINFY